METVKLGKGQHFLRKGERMRELYVILQGSVRAISKNDEFEMEAGSIVGMMESDSGEYLCDYIAATDCVCYVYPYKGTQDYKKIFAEEEKYVAVFTMAAMRQTAMLLKRYRAFYQAAGKYYEFLKKSYEEYKIFCKGYQLPEKKFQRLEFMPSVQLQEQVEDWTLEYYERMGNLSLKAIDQMLFRDYQLGIGEILNAAHWMKQALELIETVKEYLIVHKDLLISTGTENVFQRYFDLAKRAAAAGADMELLFSKISEIMEYAKASQLYPERLLTLHFSLYENYDFQQSSEEDMLIEDEIEEEEEQEEEEEGGDYLTRILDYAQYEEEEGADFRNALEEYKALADMYSTSDDVRKLRKRIVNHFYKIYEQVFWQSIERKNIPVSVKMFLNFGFIDAELAGEDNVGSLYNLTQELHQCRARNVFTIYEWLLSIYRGENEPSRNEFDMDYLGYLNEQKKTGRITAAQMKEMQEDRRQKVEYEMRNMFPTTNRATYGKISVYIPILQENDIINSVENMLVTAQKLNQAIDTIRKIDYSLFYREVPFSDPVKEVNREMIQKEVLPYIILMPNAGSKAMMWQETAGIKKDTQARFIFPIMTAADVTELMIEVTGRFRWEMCRKIQGIRWNDITEPSLTSEYNDYIQYYRKNHDLSAEAREKIKNSLFKAKNNYREVFVKDYQNWIKYESKGSFRLNKVARAILFKYCPFSADIRRKLKANPMYSDMFEKYEILKERKVRHMQAWYDRYEKKGGVINEALQENREFYDM